MPAVCKLLFTDTGYNFVSAPVLFFAAGTGNFLIGDSPVTIADLEPKLGSMVQFLIGFFKGCFAITRTGGAVVSAGRNDFSAG